MEKIKISNFRKIKDEWNIELNPVTFLTGRNNSGKSTIIKSILLLKDYFDSDNFFRLNFSGPNTKNHKITSFSNAINYFNKQKNRHENILKFEFQNDRHSILLEFYEGKNGYGNLKKIEIEDRYGYVFGIYSNLYYSLSENKLNDVISEKTLPKNSSREKKYLIKIPDLTFNPGIQELEANRLLKKILNSSKREPLYVWFFNDKDIKDIAHRCLGRLLKEKEKVINIDGISSLKKLNSLKSEVHLLEKENNITNKEDYFDDIKINIDNEIYLLTNKWDEESRMELYILMDSFNFLPSEDDIIHFHQKNSIVKPIELLEEDSNITAYRNLLLKIRNHDTEDNSLINGFEIDPDTFEIKNKFKYGGEKLFLKEYLEELIFDKSSNDEMRQQSKNVQHKRTKAPSYFRNLRLLSTFMDRAKKINLSYLSPFKYHQKNFYSLHHDENEAQLALINNSIVLSKDSEYGKTYKKFVTEWIQKFEVGYSYEFKDVNINKTKEKLGVQIFIGDEDNNFVNLKDKGLGSGQIFFMILNIANLIFSKSEVKYRRMRNPKLLLIEEPECNLHPALQSRLANLFHAITSEGEYNLQDQVHLLIETHSEYIIRKSQNIVKNQPSAKNIFKTYYIKDDGKKDDKPESLEYNENGTFKNKFGTGFFDEARNLKLDLF